MSYRDHLGLRSAGGVLLGVSLLCTGCMTGLHTTNLTTPGGPGGLTGLPTANNPPVVSSRPAATDRAGTYADTSPIVRTSYHQNRPAVSSDPNTYTLKTQDVLYWSVSSSYRLPDGLVGGKNYVGPDGNVSLGKYGSLNVIGMTAEQARVAILYHLRRQARVSQLNVSLTVYANSAVAESPYAANTTDSAGGNPGWKSSQTLTPTSSRYGTSGTTTSPASSGSPYLASYQGAQPGATPVQAGVSAAGGSQAEPVAQASYSKPTIPGTSPVSTPHGPTVGQPEQTPLASPYAGAGRPAGDQATSNPAASNPAVAGLTAANPPTTAPAETAQPAASPYAVNTQTAGLSPTLGEITMPTVAAPAVPAAQPPAQPAVAAAVPVENSPYQPASRPATPRTAQRAAWQTVQPASLSAEPGSTAGVTRADEQAINLGMPNRVVTGEYVDGPVMHHQAAPHELSKVSLPPYIIEPPDVLLIESPQAKPSQPIFGQHLVRPDGTVGLGLYGSVYVAGMTLDQAKATIEAHLKTQKLKDPEVSIDVLAYNSKVYYVITDGGGYGEQVARFPITGNETVLDAIAQINGLSPVSSKKHIWIARRSNLPGCAEEILPVDWCGTTQHGQVATNYQVLPGDRIYIKADRWRTFDAAVAKVISPFERMLGVTLLGSSTVNSIKNGGNSGNGTGR